MRLQVMGSRPDYYHCPSRAYCGGHDCECEHRLGSPTPDQVADEIIKALATPDQAHVFPDFKKAKNLDMVLTDYIKIVVEEGNP